MANLILRPFADGTYHGWDGWAVPGPVSHVTTYDLINEEDSDGDDRYVTTTEPAAFTVTLSTAFGGSWPRATRTPSVRVVATVRTAGASSSFRFRLRLLGTDYDSDLYTVTAGSYVEIGQMYERCPNMHDWELASVNHLEMGLVFVSGDEMRCTKMELFVHEEVVPHYTLTPDGNGFNQDWSTFPATSPAHMVVNGAYDGDLSYIHDTTVNNVSVFTADDLPATLTPPNIDKVAVQALVKNVGALPEVAGTMLRSGGVNYRGGTNTVGVSIPADSKWHRLREDYLNDPAVGWPSGLPAATVWTTGEVAALEIGVENAGGGSFRCTEISADVWLTPTPVSTINQFPTANGFHTDWSATVPGPPAWTTVSEDPPDNAASYILLDADTAGTPQYASFTVGGAGALALGERIFNVELRHRVRLYNLPHSEALVAPVVRTRGGTYVGRPQKIEGTGGIWFDVKWDFPTNPHSGTPWVDIAEVQLSEWGFVVLEGAVILSRLRTQIQTIYDYRGTSDPTELQLTDGATITYLPRSLLDGTIFAVTQFSVGTDGYSPIAPYTATAVNTADVALGAEVYRANIAWLEYDVTGAPWTVDYWCRVPRDEALGGIGEIGLWAEILWSPIPAEIGTYFLYAIAHHPCQARHENDVFFYVIQITY